MVDIRREYDDLKAALTALSPFLSSLLRKMRILITKSPTVPLAATTENDELVLNEEAFKQLSFRDAAWIILHEVLHIAFQDIRRRGSKNPFLWNLAADGVNNELLKNWLGVSYELSNSLVFMETLRRLLYDQVSNINDFDEYSKEEIYELLEKKPWPNGANCPACGSRGRAIKDEGYRVRMRCPKCGEEWTAYKMGDSYAGGMPDISDDIHPVKKPSDSEVLQQGDRELYGKSKEERREAWKEEVAKAYTSEKMAGTIPAGLKRIVERLLKPQVNWKTLLRQAFYEGYGKTIVASYSRPSRKHPDFPGIRRFTTPRCHFGIDCSGSISKEELAQAVSETYAISKTCHMELLVTPWDTETYEATVVKKPGDVTRKLARRLRGYGGTEIEPWLRLVDKNMKPRDLVVVFTDGDIFDIETERVKQLFNRIASKASVAIFLTTHREHHIPGWKTIKLRVH